MYNHRKNNNIEFRNYGEVKRDPFYFIFQEPVMSSERIYPELQLQQTGHLDN